MKLRYFSGLLIISVALSLCAPHGNGLEAAGKITLYFFYGKTCPACKKLEPEVDRLAKRYGVAVKKYEVWHNLKNRDKLLKMLDKLNKNTREYHGVPLIILGNEVMKGGNASAVEALIRRNQR